MKQHYHSASFRDALAVRRATTITGLFDAHPDTVDTKTHTRPMPNVTGTQLNALSGMAEGSQVNESGGLHPLPKIYFGGRWQVPPVKESLVLTPDYITTTTSGNTALTSSSKCSLIVSGTATGHSITLPNATLLGKGWSHNIYNTSTQTISVKNFDGTIIFTIPTGGVAQITLESNSTTAGNWLSIRTFMNQASGILHYKVTSTTSFATTSATDVAITGFSLTPIDGTYAVWFNGTSSYSNASRRHWWNVYVGGTLVGDSEREQTSTSSNRAMVDSAQTTVDVTGSQVVDVRVRCDPAGGTLTMTNRSLILIRLGDRAV